MTPCVASVSYLFAAMCYDTTASKSESVVVTIMAIVTLRRIIISQVRPTGSAVTVKVVRGSFL